LVVTIINGDYEATRRGQDSVKHLINLKVIQPHPNLQTRVLELSLYLLF